VASSVDPPRTPAVGPARRTAPVRRRKSRRNPERDGEVDEEDAGQGRARDGGPRKGRHIDERC